MPKYFCCHAILPNNAVDITCVSIVFKQVLMPLFQAHEVLGLVPDYISVYLFFPHE